MGLDVEGATIGLLASSRSIHAPGSGHYPIALDQTPSALFLVTFAKKSA